MAEPVTDRIANRDAAFAAASRPAERGRALPFPSDGPSIVTGSILQSLLRSCRIVPLPDAEGLGLLTFAVDVGSTVAALAQALPVPNLLGAPGPPSPTAELPVALGGLPPAVELPPAVQSVSLAGSLSTESTVTVDTTPGLPGGEVEVTSTTTTPLDAITADLTSVQQTVSLPTSLAGTLNVPVVDLRTVADLLGVEVGAVWSVPDAAPLLPLDPPGVPGPARGAASLLARFLPLPEVTTRPEIRTTSVTASIGIDTIVQSLQPGAVPGLVGLPALPDDVLAALRLALPTIAVPPVLALFVGREYSSPVLVITPTDVGGHSVDALLDHAAAVLQQLDRVLRLVPTEVLDLPVGQLPLDVDRYVAVATALRALVRVIGGPNVRLLASHEEPNLNLFDLRLGWLNDTEAEDEFSSFVYVGLPGTSVDLFTRRDFRGGRVRLGISAPMATAGRFIAAHPQFRDVHSANPAGGILEVDRGDEDQLVFGFGNRASSFRFDGVGTTPLDEKVAQLRDRLGF